MAYKISYDNTSRKVERGDLFTFVLDQNVFIPFTTENDPIEKYQNIICVVLDIVYYAGEISNIKFTTCYNEVWEWNAFIEEDYIYSNYDIALYSDEVLNMSYIGRLYDLSEQIGISGFNNVRV